MAPSSLKPGVIKDPAIAILFSTKDPEIRYQDLREIGHGSFGAVFFAYDKEHTETVAVKKMNFSGKQASEKWTDIIKEVSFLSKIKHPHIVDYKACFLKDTTCWLVMEYCIGSAADIVDVLRKGMREVEIGAICAQTLEALCYLHSMKRIHRDIKAGNILLSDQAIVKLADFGSASLTDPAQTFIGTPFFMAPEVILAMDEGNYTDRADIWSLGITCIELAERRPPLFSMNAMSALYHIAQNEPPTLAPVDADQSQWTPEFVSFIEKCLRKTADERMSAAECLRHPFIARSRPADTIQELITRTKNMVLELDNFQYKKMRKLMYLDETEGRDSETNGCGSDDLDFNGHEALSIDKAGDSASSRSASLASFRSMQSSGGNGMLVSTNTSGAEPFHGSSGYMHGGSSTSAARRRPPIPNSLLTMPSSSTANSVSTSGIGTGASGTMSRRNNDSQGSTLIAVGSGPSALDTQSSSFTASTVTTNGIDGSEDVDEGVAMSTSNVSSSAAASNSEPFRSPIKDLHMPKGDLKEKIETLQNRKFATLRSAKLINREQEEYSKENNMYEQMSGYKRLRQMHHKELQQFEERCSAEREALRIKLDKELDQLNTNYGKEKQRVRMVHQSDLDKKKREIEEGEKKLKKQTANNNQQQMKAYSAQQLREYKHNKEAHKTRLRSFTSSKSAYESAVKDMKAQLNRQKEALENEYEAKLREAAEEEHVKYRRQQLSRLHSLEEKLDNDDVNIQERQMEIRQAMLVKQHDMTRELEISHLKELHALKKRHQDAQHEAESANQNDYTKRQTEDLRKRHALQCRQQPRELKLKEQQIRKQYRQAVKTQTRQFKLFQTQVLQMAPREEQKEIGSRLKEEQTRKIALLGSQYESQIKKMVEDKTVKLESWQEDEARHLGQKLEKELDELIAYQKKQRTTLEEQISKEKTALEERIGARRALVEQRIREEREEMANLRAMKQEQLRERHGIARQRLENSFMRTSSSRSFGMGGASASSIQLQM